MNHTASQWTVAPFSPTDIVANGDHIVNARSGMNGLTREEAIANARLIAAAPELLAALQLVADYWAGGDVPADIDAAIRAAIARATQAG